MGHAVVNKQIALAGNDESSPRAYTQESLMAYVDVVRCTRTVFRAFDGQEWSLERLTRMMAILKGTLHFHHFVRMPLPP